MRSATGQKARVRAKCVRAKVVGCGVRAWGQKSVTPNTLVYSVKIEKCRLVTKEILRNPYIIFLLIFFNHFVVSTFPQKFFKFQRNDNPYLGNYSVLKLFLK